MSEFSRRDILRCLALGGAVVAGELWIPGQRVISIPNAGLALTAAEWVSLIHADMSRVFDIAYAKYQDVFVACYQEGGAIRSVVSKDGIDWEHIKHKDLFVDA